MEEYQGWDPREMDKVQQKPTVKGMHMPENMHRECRIKELFGEFVITVIVMEWDSWRSSRPG